MGERYLTSGLLLDTRILVRWLAEPGKLSKEQKRVISQTLERYEPVNISDVTLIEVASVIGRSSKRSHVSARELFDALEAELGFRIIPIDIGIGREAEALGGALRDLWDRAIVATARVHGLRLVTSDEKIIDSNLVSVVE